MLPTFLVLIVSYNTNTMFRQRGLYDKFVDFAYSKGTR